MDQNLRRIVDTIVTNFDPDKVVLFGSRARGNAGVDSDYDICILKRNVGHRRKLAQGVYRSLYGTGLAVDVIVESPELFDELKDTPGLIYREIARYGEILYDRDGPFEGVVPQGSEQP